MKFLSILLLNIALISIAQAAGRSMNEIKPVTQTTQAADAAQVQKPDAQQLSAQKHEVLKTQFLGKRPYVEKTAK